METRYTKALRSATRGYDACAALIVALTLVAVWPDKKRLGLVVLMGVAGAMNTYINLRVIPKLGDARGEVVRLLYNLATSVPLSHYIGWPIPTFLWLPFAALYMNHLDKRVARGIVAANCTVVTLVAVMDHVPVMIPLAFVVAAVIGRITTEANAAALCALVDEAEATNKELEHARKLEALGRLAAGVAHEINTPMQYIGDSIDFARSATADLMHAVHAKTTPDDLEFLDENLPLALERAREGIDRIARIVRSMRTFAHPGTTERAPVDINHLVECVLAIAQSEYRHVAAIETRLQPIPPVACDASELNQVFLNLIVNAAHAVADRRVKDGDAEGRIVVRTHRDGADVVVEVADTGSGIPESIRDKVMEPFFTTKPIGKGTGQGLAIARSLVEAHGGSLAFESETGLGTTFRVRLPIAA